MAEENPPNLSADLRSKLIAQPDLILSDRDVMRALIGAREAELGENVIDIRGMAMQALESRLDRLETAHETVISTAYDNQSGMNTVHRAVISLLEPIDFDAFLENLETNVAPILHVETLRLLMASGSNDMLPRSPGTLHMVSSDLMSGLISGGRRAPRGDDIVLRSVASQTLPYHGQTRAPIRSEALLPIDLGPGRFPAVLLIGSAELSRFTPAQGTDLLRFFGQVFRLVLIGWLRE